MIDTFEWVRCVSLARTEKRWDRFLKDLPEDWPFKTPEKFEAIDGKFVKPPAWWSAGPRAWGCYRSHMTILEQALNCGVKSVLFLEDDAFVTESFTKDCHDFITALPDDWGMIYLGGQHLYPARHPPLRINDYVYRPWNVNRTHAFALRGKMMSVVYDHLFNLTFSQGHHIDHHLGRLHQRRNDPIYCPKEWMIGQREGRSEISGKHLPDRVWAAAETVAGAVSTDAPFVAVVGLHSSGSSCIAGVLHHLGIHLGNELTGYYGKDPDKNCGFEAKGLAVMCESAIPFPSTEYKWKRPRVWRWMKDWVAERKMEAFRKGTIAGCKYPMLCRFGDQLLNINNNLVVVNCVRPLEDSIASLIKRSGSKFSAEKLDAHQRWLNKGKNDLLAKSQNIIDVDYYRLLEDPRTVVISIAEQLTGFCGNFCDDLPERIEKAVQYVKPSMCNIKENQYA